MPWRKVAQGGVGRAYVRDGKLHFELVFFRVFGMRPVSKGVAKDLFQETVVQRGFLLDEIPLLFEIGPVLEDLVCVVASLRAIQDFVGFLGQKTPQEEPRPPAAPRSGEQLGDNAAVSIRLFLLCHSLQILWILAGIHSSAV